MPSLIPSTFDIRYFLFDIFLVLIRQRICCFGALTLLIFLPCPGLSQIHWHTNIHLGPTLQINPVFPEITQISGLLEVGIRYKTFGNKLWHERYGFPEIGLSAVYLSLGNPEVLGWGVSLLPTFRGIMKAKGKFQLHYVLATSLVFSPNIFDRISNPSNNVLGSRMSNLTHLGLEGSWHIDKRWTCVLGFSGTHISNSHVRIPNLGVNIPAWKMGVQYQISPPTTEPIASQADTSRASGISLYPGIRLGYGFTASKIPNGPVHPVYLASLHLNTFWRNKIRFRIGLEGFFNESIYSFFRNHQADWVPLPSGAIGIAMYGGFEFALGRFSLMGQLGPYLKRAELMDYLLYTKLGVQYYWIDQQVQDRMQPFLGVYVHSHSGEADFAEIGIGWLF